MKKGLLYTTIVIVLMLAIMMPSAVLAVSQNRFTGQAFVYISNSGTSIIVGQQGSLVFEQVTGEQLTGQVIASEGWDTLNGASFTMDGLSDEAVLNMDSLTLEGIATGSIDLIKKDETDQIIGTMKGTYRVIIHGNFSLDSSGIPLFYEVIDAAHFDLTGTSGIYRQMEAFGEAQVKLTPVEIMPGVTTLGGYMTMKNSYWTVPNPTIITGSPLPSGSVGVPYSLPLSVCDGIPPFIWSKSNGTIPLGLTLDPSGMITGTPTTATSPVFFTVKVTDSVGGSATKVFYMTISSGPIITNDNIAEGNIGDEYYFTLFAFGGKSPYIWSIMSGALPAGLSMDPTSGIVSGTPTETGTYPLIFRVIDKSLRMATISFSLAVYSGPVIKTVSPLLHGEVGVAYYQKLEVAGGTLPYIWAIHSGHLPEGLSLNPSTGEITGTPASAVGSFTLTIDVTDNKGKMASKEFSINTVTACKITTVSPLPIGEVGIAYVKELTIVGGMPPFNWSTLGGRLPPGLALNPQTGIIWGLPTVTTDTITIAIKVVDSLGGNSIVSLLIKVIPNLSISTPSQLPDGQVDVLYTVPLEAIGGKPPYAWNLKTGVILGLSLDQSTGKITGTPTTATSPITFTVEVKDSLGGIGTKVLTITILPKATKKPPI